MRYQMTFVMLLCAFTVFSATWTVTNTNDSGPGSLREAVASAAFEGDVIDFAVEGTILLNGIIRFDRKHLTINGPGMDILVLDAQNGPGIFHSQAYPLSSLKINNMTLQNCLNGAAIRMDLVSQTADADVNRLVVHKCKFRNNANFTSDGGAICAKHFAHLEITQSIFESNIGTTGRAVYIEQNPSFVLIPSTIKIQQCRFSNYTCNFQGGAIHLNIGKTADVLVDLCEFTNNVATNGGGAIFWYEVAVPKSAVLSRSTFTGNKGGSTGVLYHAGQTQNFTHQNCLVVENSTFSSNLNNLTPIFNVGKIWLRNCTITGNITGLYNSNTCFVENTLIAGNTTDVAGASNNSLGNNLIGKGGPGFTNGVNGDIVGTSTSPIDPKLDFLQYDGGYTKVHPLLPGSPAIDAGHASSVTVDQRGMARPQGAAPDIGSFEVDPAVPPVAENDSTGI